MAENTALRTANEALEQKLYAMEERLAAVKHNFSEHAPAKVEEQQAGIRAVLDQDIRQQIDHYLSEIDQCIDWLRQQ